MPILLGTGDEAWCQYFQIDDNTRSKVRAALGTDAVQVRKQVDELVEWARKQPRLPRESQDHHYVERLLLRYKWNIDKCKAKMQIFFDTLGKHPEIFNYMFSVRPSTEHGLILGLPISTPRLERILLLKLPSPPVPYLDMDKCVIYFLTFAFLLIYRDYVVGTRFILDFDGVTLRHISKVTPWFGFKMMSFYEKMFKISITGIELINCPHLVNFALSFAKVVAKPKLYSRITIHKNLDSLYTNVPRTVLPKEYGGDSKSIDALIVDWDMIMKQEEPLFSHAAKLVQSLNEEVKPEPDFWLSKLFRTYNIK